MKICILSSFEDSLDRKTGYSIRIYSLARNLARMGNEVHLVIPKCEFAQEELEGIQVHSMKGFLPRGILYALARLLGVVKATSLYFYDPVFVLRAGRIIRDSDVVQLEQQPMGGLFIPIVRKVWNKPVVVDCHDVFQALRIAHTSNLRRILETFFEQIAYRLSDKILNVSDLEKEILAAHGIEPAKIEVISNGVDTEAFDRNFNAAYVKKTYGLGDSPMVVFVGNLAYLPNVEAVHLISSEIAPRVQREIKDAKFVIVGRTEARMDAPGLVFTGSVESVVPLLAAADVAVAPLLHGSGTRLKILEYFSCSLPVVATSIGAEGLDVEDGLNIIIEDDIERFADDIAELLRDPDSARSLGRNARELAVRKYDWRNISVKLDNVLKSLLKS